MPQGRGPEPRKGNGITASCPQLVVHSRTFSAPKFQNQHTEEERTSWVSRRSVRGSTLMYLKGKATAAGRASGGGGGGNVPPLCLPVPPLGAGVSGPPLSLREPGPDASLREGLQRVTMCRAGSPSRTAGDPQGHGVAWKTLTGKVTPMVDTSDRLPNGDGAGRGSQGRRASLP